MDCSQCFDLVAARRSRAEESQRRDESPGRIASHDLELIARRGSEEEKDRKEEAGVRNSLIEDEDHTARFKVSPSERATERAVATVLFAVFALHAVMITVCVPAIRNEGPFRRTAIMSRTCHVEDAENRVSRGFRSRE